MNQKYQTILELDKILERLKKEILVPSNLKYLENITFENDLDTINNMLDEVDEATQIIERMGRFSIYSQTDIRELTKKASKGMILQIEELLELTRFLDTIKNLSLFDTSLINAGILEFHFNDYVRLLIYSKELNLRIKDIINPFGEIMDSASPALRSIRNAIKDTEKRISSKLSEIINKNSSKLTQALVTIRNDRYVIPVKNDMKNTIKGITHDTSSSGETVFIEPLIICEMNNHLNSLKEDEKKEIYRILKEVSESVALEEDNINTSYNILADLDLIFSKAAFSLSIKGNRPRINKDGIIELLNCYHPLLNVPNIVKNNVIIGKEYQGIIITGPNTGGKTVLLKTIGLLSMMLKIGLLIPCSNESNVMIFDDIYADIGDEQSIDQNLSTFSSHMKNTIEIMNKVDHNSLVLLDELGSGTDPTEGAALAISIFDFLISRKCLVIASSHYAELKIHAYETENIINASVEFNVETLKPTYKLLIGVPGESNALKICKHLGLPEEIIVNAEKYAYNNTNDINLTLEKLIKQSNVLEKKLNDIHEKDLSLNKQLLDVDKLRNDIYQEKKKILIEAKNEADKIIEKSQKEINSLISDLKEMKLKEVKSHEVSEVVHRARELSDSTEINISKPIAKREIGISDNVYIEKFATYGKVIKINKNKYEVQVGNATMTLTKDDLELTNVEQKQATTPRREIKPFSPRKTVSMNLDLRGMRYEDADSLIDNYISDALYSGLRKVTIIHGFGTGVIRELVQKKMKTNRNVEEYRYGGQNEGGQGVTIVTLKD